MRYPFRAGRLAVATLVSLGLASFSQAASPPRRRSPKPRHGRGPARSAVDRLATGIRRRPGLLRRRLVDDRSGIGGRQCADVRISPLDPSAQDFYLSSWTSKGPGGAATDDERAIPRAYAGGLQTCA